MDAVFAGAAPPARVSGRRVVWPLLVDAAVAFGLTAAGLLCGDGVGRWYRALLVGFVGLAGPVLLVAALVSWLAERQPVRIQGPRRRPMLLLRGVRDTALAAWIAACLLAWPLSRMWAGRPTGLMWSIEAAGGTWRVLLQTFFGLLVLDAWLYFKHRLLHTRLLFPFHRAHHTYRDPTAFAAFAVGPVESLLTFWPVMLVGLPQAPHWAPLYFALVVGFITLNLYLHCGVELRPLEATLPRLLVNTSAFHNLHHSNADTHFGEALTLWDRILKTTER